jgi:elongation factor P
LAYNWAINFDYSIFMGLTNTITRGMVIMFNNEPYIVIEKEFYAPAKGASFHRTKLKNIKNGKVIPHTVKSVEKVEELDVETKTMQYLYNDEKDAYFMDPVSFDQISVPLDQIPNETDYLHADGKYILLIYEGKAISVQLPLKMTLEVTETGEGIRGNTATNATKDAILETGLKVQVPLFIKNHDRISINTETGTYYSKEN